MATWIIKDTELKEDGTEKAFSILMRPGTGTRAVSSIPSMLRPQVGLPWRPLFFIALIVKT